MALSRFVTLIALLAFAVSACSPSPSEPTASGDGSATPSAVATLSNVSPETPATESDAPSTPDRSESLGEKRIESVEGTMISSVPGSWVLDASAVDRRAGTQGVEDVLGVWTVDTTVGEHRVIIEADAQGGHVFDAESYFEAFFADTDAGLGQEVKHEFFTAADGSSALWVTATAADTGVAVDEIAFFLFSSERIVVGRATATTEMDQDVAEVLRAIGAELTP